MTISIAAKKINGSDCLFVILEEMISFTNYSRTYLTKLVLACSQGNEN